MSPSSLSADAVTACWSALLGAGLGYGIQQYIHSRTEPRNNPMNERVLISGKPSQLADLSSIGSRETNRLLSVNAHASRSNNIQYVEIEASTQVAGERTARSLFMRTDQQSASSDSTSQLSFPSAVTPTVRAKAWLNDVIEVLLAGDENLVILMCNPDDAELLEGRWLQHSRIRVVDARKSPGMAADGISSNGPQSSHIMGRDPVVNKATKILESFLAQKRSPKEDIHNHEQESHSEGI